VRGDSLGIIPMDSTFAARISQALADAPPHATGVAVIRLGAIRRNYARLRTLSSTAVTSGVVKANAYGLGVAKVLPALEQEGCRTAFVATLAEAREVRSFSAATVYVLDGLLPGTAPLFEEADARPVLCSLDEAAEWAAHCKARGNRLSAAIHLDTGMTRLGFPQAQARQLADTPELLAAFDLSLVMSHLACADEPSHPKNADQLSRFAALASLFPTVPRSFANSAGILLGQPYHFELTRPGIGLYGGRPLGEGENPMEPALWLYGRIAEVADAGAGQTVGYSATATLTRPSRIATVTAGYADGLFRALSPGGTKSGPCAYAGAHALPLLGRVSMDLMTYDATDAPRDAVRRGGFLELLGARVGVDDLAAFAGTIGYEVLTSLGGRYTRVYLDD
jgi:alanine racemase